MSTLLQVFMDYLFDQNVVALHCVGCVLWGSLYLTPYLPNILTPYVTPGTLALTRWKLIVSILCSEVVLFLPWVCDFLDFSIAVTIACVWIIIFLYTNSGPRISIKHGAVFKPGKISTVMNFCSSPSIINQLS